MKNFKLTAIIFTFWILIFRVCGATEYNRVVSLLPSHTEIIRDLKLENKLVGVSESEEKNAFSHLPRVGSFTPNWEILVSLKPDLILADVSHKRYENTFKRLSLPVRFLNATRSVTLEDVFQLIMDVGNLFDRTKEAERKVNSYKKRLQVIENSLKNQNGPFVYFEIWPLPLQTCSPTSLQGHLLSRAKAKNIIPPSENTMPFISMEWVAKKAPDVVLHTGVVTSEEIKKRPGWNTIPAIKENRVFIVNRDLYSRAGPKIVDALENLVEILYGKNK